MMLELETVWHDVRDRGIAIVVCEAEPQRTTEAKTASCGILIEPVNQTKDQIQ